ncbi:L domain-like protein [Panus rudis PR-1116 ss-1]|nr:L domain-like protein [Panus rudis PR-1116 ss-1]
MTTTTPTPPMFTISRDSQDGRYPKMRHNELTISVPPPDVPIEVSRFSPESPPLPPVPPRSRAASPWSDAWTRRASSTVAGQSKDVESNARTSLSPRRMSTPEPETRDYSTYRSRFTKLFFDLRTLVRNKEPEIVPIQPPQLPPWEPLHIEKRGCCHDCPCHTQKVKTKKKRSKRDKILIYLLVLVILYLLGNTLFLDIRVLNPSSTTTTATPSNDTASTSTQLSPSAQQCLSQYTINAPSDPSSYPCSSCLPILQQVPSDFSSSNQSDVEQIQNAIQFCGLRAFFETADSDGQSALGNGGWVKDVRFCAWNGVGCDGAGRVSSLTLTFPGVPALLPNETGALTGLTSLRVIGNSAIPAGSLPPSFTSLQSLLTLHLESTSITTLPSTLFTSLSKLTSLELIKNGQMGKDLPSSITSLSLQNLVVNGQPLTNPLSSIASSPSLQRSLQLIDFTSTSLTGTIPSLTSLTSLVELHLDSNNLSGPLPSAFPSSLVALTLSNNSGLGGNGGNAQGVCALTGLKQCDLRGSGLSAPNGGCGTCQF